MVIFKLFALLDLQFLRALLNTFEAKVGGLFLQIRVHKILQVDLVYVATIKSGAARLIFGLPCCARLLPFGSLGVA